MIYEWARAWPIWKCNHINAGTFKMILNDELIVKRIYLDEMKIKFSHETFIFIKLSLLYSNSNLYRYSALNKYECTELMKKDSYWI